MRSDAAGGCRTQGRAFLRQYFIASGATIAEVARAVGCSRSTLHRIAIGAQPPSLEDAVRIERLAAVPCASSFEAEAVSQIWDGERATTESRDTDAASTAA